MNWRHTDFQSVALPTELPRRQPHMLPHPFSPSIEPPFQCDMNPLTQVKRMYYILPQAPTLYVGPNQGKGHRSPMSRYSLHRPRRNRAVWDRSATGTRLLPKSSPTTVSPGYPLPGDGRSIDYTRHTLFHGHSRVRALSERRSTPATATRPSGGIGHDCNRALPGGHSAPSSLHRRLPRKTPFTQRRQRGCAPSTLPNGRARVGFNPLSGLPRRPPRRTPASQRRQ